MAKWYCSVEKWECLSNCTYRSNSVDGRIVCFHFTHQITSFSWPQFDVSGPATGNDRMASRKEAKAAYPIFMGVIQGFDDLKTEKKISQNIWRNIFSNISCRFQSPNRFSNLYYNYSNVQDLKNILEQVKNHSVSKIVLSLLK